MPQVEDRCLFCRLVRGEGERYPVLEEECCVAFLDHRPLFPGHTLLVPRQHFETLADLPSNLLAPLFGEAQVLARAVEIAFGALGSFVAINNRVSQSVPHLHVHVVPRRPKDGLKGFFWPRRKYSGPEAIREVQEALRSAVAQVKARR